MAGFTKVKYETDAGTIARIRVDDDKVALVGTPPAGAVTESNLLVSVTTSRRSQTKLRARAWEYSRSVDVEGEDAKLRFSLSVPKVTEAAFDGTPADTLPYGGEVWTFERKRPEE